MRGILAGADFAGRSSGRGLPQGPNERLRRRAGRAAAGPERGMAVAVSARYPAQSGKRLRFTKSRNVDRTLRLHAPQSPEKSLHPRRTAARNPPGQSRLDMASAHSYRSEMSPDSLGPSSHRNCARQRLPPANGPGSGKSRRAAADRQQSPLPGTHAAWTTARESIPATGDPGRKSRQKSGRKPRQRRILDRPDQKPPRRPSPAKAGFPASAQKNTPSSAARHIPGKPVSDCPSPSTEPVNQTCQPNPSTELAHPVTAHSGIPPHRRQPTGKRPFPH